MMTRFILNEDHDCYERTRNIKEAAHYLYCPHMGVIVCEPKRSSEGMVAQAKFFHMSCRSCCEILSATWNPICVEINQQGHCWRLQK